MTPADILLTALIRAQGAGTVAILLVLLLRVPVRRLAGAEIAYRLWGVPPAIAAVGLFPAMSEFLAGEAATLEGALSHHADPLLMIWLAGAVALALMMVASEAGFRRRVAKGEAGPAVVGVLWPRMITPRGYTERFTAAERELIRQHEHAHIALGHPLANLTIAVLQALSWFNPLVHVAAVCARFDQELACDAAVLERRPEKRRLYGETLLKAHLAGPSSPFACPWLGPSRHPLEVRLAMLAEPPVSLALYLRGAAVVGLVATFCALSVWSAGPRWTAESRFVWPTARSQGAAAAEMNLDLPSLPAT